MLLFFTFDCLAASNWPPGHPRSDHHVSNPHRPDYCYVCYPVMIVVKFLTCKIHNTDTDI